MCKQLYQWIGGRSLNLQAALWAIGVFWMLLVLERFGLLHYFNLALGWLLMTGLIASAVIFIVAVILRLSVR